MTPLKGWVAFKATRYGVIHFIEGSGRTAVCGVVMREDAITLETSDGSTACATCKRAYRKAGGK